MSGSATFRPGDVATVRKDIWSHEGIIGLPDRRGLPTVYAASGTLGRVVHQSWEAFTSGQQATNTGYPGRLPRAVVVARAASQVGRPYAPATFNCQHLARFAHGLEPYSWQARLCGLGAAGLAAFWLYRA